MESAELKGVRAKLDWAQQHFRNIDSAIQRHWPSETEQEVPSSSSTLDAQTKQLVIRLAKRTPLEPSLPLMVGDCVHSMRSALDHLAYQLAFQHSPSRIAEWERRIQFPIYLKEHPFNDFVQKSVAPYISGTALTEIKQLQPYTPGNDGIDDIIWIIQQLDVIDKHRLLVVAVEQFRPVEIVSTGNVPVAISDLPTEWKRAEDGAEVFRIDLSRVADVPGKMSVHIKTAHSVHLKETGLCCDGYPVLQVLNESMSFVGYVVDDFGKKFFGE